MKIPSHFDPSIGIEKISVKETESTHGSLPKGSPANSHGALSLALVNNFLTYRLKHFLMDSLTPEAIAQGGLLKDRLQRLLKLLSEEKEVRETELLLHLQEDFNRQETLMEERQRHIGP